MARCASACAAGWRTTNDVVAADDGRYAEGIDMGSPSIWMTRGFEEFRRGTFGNGGQNLYVSRSGVLQRIHQYDFNGDGYLDLVFCNSQNHWERPPTYVFGDVLGDPFRGMTAVGPGNQRDRGPEEYYVSAPFELPGEARVTRIEWDAGTPEKTWVRAQLRFAATEMELDGACWSGPGGGEGWFENGGDAGGYPFADPWIQYRLALGAVNGVASPRVTEVRVHYT